MKKQKAALAAILFVLVVAGCSSVSQGTPPVDNELSPQPEDTTVPDQPTSQPVDPPGDESAPSASTPVVERAVADLAERLGIAAADIEVVSVEQFTWQDGSLGCPQPGRDYTQALVNGSRIVLRADRSLYDYHSGGGRDPFLCEQTSLEIVITPNKKEDGVEPPPGLPDE